MKAPRTRVQRRPVHGVFLLDKPIGLSSNDALQKVKWLLRAEKAGHTGTLDPLATGVLPLCFGAATKFSQLQLDAPKTYEALVHLGATTTTGDAEGEVMQIWEVDALALTPEKLAAVAAQFTGAISQVPPMYSALKRDGKALYEYARAGITLEREPRAVTILHLALSRVEEEQAFTALKMTVRCSKGTYVRTLAEDIGQALGYGAHLRSLRRIETGGIDLSRCVSLQTLEALPDDQRLQTVLPADTLLAEHTRVTLDGDNAGRFLSGLRRRGEWADADAVAVYGEEPPALLGVAHIRARELIPDRLLSPVEIQQILEGTPRPQASGILETS
ncbi:tRNA pseudouridine(55) synthase TruB [Comamonas piscis]|uniref:tRNA pseudouridine synthase B n=1 Tax=Comamonas piscis TaxID=1562974 RepID=A0A7G5EJJ1_9BURK|nr:tRNA pseudouridine(55) synthase TruB [Comamonas piscis]QMV74166.1 tRNA pseudouridine(55) synthase TruB [Comamonas piscis]WSO32606.1 tRNA pseudouridine(55) synthase TruB [Comamonas piscis]